MRWKYIIPRLVIVCGLWAFMRFGMDPLLKSTAVSATQSITGARVDIGDLTTQFFPPRIDVTKVALADAGRPGRNLVQFDELHVRFAGDPLMRRQFVVEEGRITGVRFGTQRDDDGQLEVVEDEESEPSWLSEKLTDMGSQWLESLAARANEMLDPNQLETYRVGNAVYIKWDERFGQLVTRTQSFQPRLESLQQQFSEANRASPIEKVERYLRLADEAERLRLDALGLKSELQGVVPEAKGDFAKLDQARRNDQARVMQTAELLKPDARRISESLIGDRMYRQLHEALSWMETLKTCQQQLREQARPDRSDGTTFEFPLLSPTPDFHLRKLLVSGEFRQKDKLVPFEGVLTDVTEDAPLLGRPMVFHMTTSSANPLTVQLVYDATRDVPETRIVASYTDDVRPDSAADQAGLAMELTAMSWHSEFTLRENAIDGRIGLQSRVNRLSMASTEGLRPEIHAAANEALSAIKSVQATLLVSGDVRKPQMRVESDLGEQVSAGLQTAIRTQIAAAKQKLIAEVDSLAQEQAQRLSAQFSSQYDQLLARNSDIMQQIQGVQTIVNSVKSGRVDPGTIFRTATESKLIDDRYQQKIDGTLNDVNKKLRDAGLPQGLPGILPLRRR